MSYSDRIAALHASLADLPGAVVAFSGGVDSAMLLHACQAALGANVLAVTADSASLPRAELDEARAFTAAFGIEHRVLPTDELEREGYRRNAPDRCYFCKTELFETIASRLRGMSEWPVLYGAIADDASDHRPGAKAAAEHAVLAPLADAELSKDDVRRYSREHGLPTSAKPAFACLASRVPYGTEIDRALLQQLEAAEAVLRDLGYRQYRVRHHGAVARIELDPEELPRAIEERDRIVTGLRAAGYAYVALDLAGYRTGSLNETLS